MSAQDDLVALTSCGATIDEKVRVRLNWDPNERATRSRTKTTWSDTESRRPSASYLNNLTRDQVLSYWRFISGKKLSDEIRAVEAAILRDPSQEVIARRDALLAKKLVLLDQVVAQDPNNLRALNDLAWNLATSPEPTARDPQRAQRLAQTAVVYTWVEAWPDCADTLAAAYGAIGDFAAAVVWQERALPGAEDRGDAPAVFKCRLALYRNGRAYEPGACPPT